MAKHTSYRGSTIDMDSMRRENEKVPAIGNMSVNAKGDKISGGVVTKTASQIARENHRVQTTIVQGSIKSPITEDVPQAIKTPFKPTSVKKTKEIELPSGDISVEDNNE